MWRVRVLELWSVGSYVFTEALVVYVRHAQVWWHVRVNVKYSRGPGGV